jgi:hypothetical protein
MLMAVMRTWRLRRRDRESDGWSRLTANIPGLRSGIPLRLRARSCAERWPTALTDPHSTG